MKQCIAIVNTTTTLLSNTTATTTISRRNIRQNNRRKHFYLNKKQDKTKNKTNKANISRRISQRYRNQIENKKILVVNQFIKNESRFFNIIRERKLRLSDKRIFYNFGYIANTSLQLTQNAAIYLSNMRASIYFSRPSNKAFHDLRDTYDHSNYNSISHNILGLGLNFIPRDSFTTDPQDIDVDRFIRDAFTKFMFAHDTSSSIPKLFIRSNFCPPDNQINPLFRARIRKFILETQLLFVRQKLSSNLLPFQRHALQNLIRNNNIVIVKTDKNLGPAILDRDTYIEKAFDEHLLTDAYRQITQEEAENGIKHIRSSIIFFINKFNIPKNDKKYLKRWLEMKINDDPYSYFYLLIKVHKTPWKTRPIISGSGGVLYALSKWVDEELKKILRFLPYRIESSKELVEKLKLLNKLPPIQLFSADAVSMYTNIDTSHALRMIKIFLLSHPNITRGINVLALMEGLRIIMTNNIFKFGDTFWLQLTGTAMGTPAAPSYATLYYFIHERTFIQHYPELTYYCRYLDDTLGVWLPHADKTINNLRYTQFQNAMQGFGSLEWTSTPLQKTIDFLDLTIFQTTNGTIGTKLYEKILNSYLYLPPHSAHAPGILSGLINGMITRIARLTTQRFEINKHINDFYTRLLHRGYKPTLLRNLFNATIIRLNIALTNLPTTSLHTSSIRIPQINDHRNECTEPGRTLILHLKYSPHDPPSTMIQQLFRDIILQPPDSIPTACIRNRNNVACNIKKLTIAFKRGLNLSNMLSIRKFKNKPTPVSTHLPTILKPVVDRGEPVNDDPIP